MWPRFDIFLYNFRSNIDNSLENNIHYFKQSLDSQHSIYYDTSRFLIDLSCRWKSSSTFTNQYRQDSLISTRHLHLQALMISVVSRISCCCRCTESAKVTQVKLLQVTNVLIPLPSILRNATVTRIKLGKILSFKSHTFTLMIVLARA